MADKNYKYAMVYSWHYEDGESCAIAHAGELEIEHNGDKWVSTREKYDLQCTETLKEAIMCSKYWAPDILFAEDFTDDECVEAANIINELVHDNGYLNKFEREGYGDREFTADDVQIINESSITFEVDPNQLRVYRNGNIIDQIEGDTSDLTDADFRNMQRGYAVSKDNGIPEPVNEPESGDDGLDNQYDG